MYELTQLLPSQTGRNLTIKIPSFTLQCQKRTFFYQAALLWNKLHKQLLKPSKVTLHYTHTDKLNLLESECIFLDSTTKVSNFKSGLKKILTNIQSHGGKLDWSKANYLSNL